MELWEKVLAAKREAEEKYPMPAHGVTTEERDAEIFTAMVAAATGKWEPSKKKAAPVEDDHDDKKKHK